MATVYIVLASVDYEGSWPIAVFDNRKDADDHAAACTVHDSRRPEWPDDPTDAEIEAYTAANTKWSEAHPAGPGASSSVDYYNVLEMPLLSARPATEQKEPGNG